MKILAIDLDKSSLNDAGEFSSEDVDSIRRFACGGNILSIASGRMTDSIRPFVNRLGIDAAIVAYNGAMVHDLASRGSRVILHEPLPAGTADEIVRMAVSRGLHVNYYLDDVLYARDSAELKMFSDLYSRQTGSVFRFVPDLGRFSGMRPTKLIIVADPVDRDRLYAELEPVYRSRVCVVRTNPEYLEFMSLEADKGKGVGALAAAHGVVRGDVIALGDGENDLPMVQYAGISVAVANATDRVKRASRLVLAATNNESPVTEALVRLEVLRRHP